MSKKFLIENKIIDYFRQNEFLSISPSLNYNLLSKVNPKSQTVNKEHIHIKEENIIQKEIRRYINIKNKTDDQFSTLYNKVQYESLREISNEDKIKAKEVSIEVSEREIDLNEKYKLIKNKFSELKHVLLSDKTIRHSFFKYLSKENTHFISFYKFIFSLILDQELSKKDLYHRIDKKVLSLIKMEDFSNDINDFLRSISKKPSFNNNF